MWQDTNEAIKRQKIEQKKIDTARPLTASERAEKEILFEQVLVFPSISNNNII
jgi:hypothetical protein